MTDSSRRSPAQRGILNLQRALRLGLTVVTELWNYPAGDWVSSVHAVDIDGDGDVEILITVRDGSIYILTKRGLPKRRVKPAGEWARNIRGIDNAEAVDKTRIVTGLRDGKVQAFDETGEFLWEYQTGHVVRQVRVHDIDHDGKTEILVASEDQHVYALASETGEALWKYRAGSWVHAIHAADVDGDGVTEILAGSGDQCIYVLDSRGRLKGKYAVESEVPCIYATDIDKDGQTEILFATDGKELYALTTRGQKKWRFQSDNRILSLAVVDLDHDGRHEIIAASQDKHLYVLDDRGKLVWRHNFNSRVFSVYAADIDNDGQVEVLVGTEESLHVLRIELMRDLRQKIFTSYKKLGYPEFTTLDLSWTEIALLQDLVSGWLPNEQQTTLEHAKQLARSENYLQALSELILLHQQKVQVLWRKKVGRVRAVFSGDLNGDGQLEVVAGTDDGGVHVFDARGEEVWSYICDDRIWTVYVGDIDLDGTFEVVAGSGGGQVYVFSNAGEIKWQSKLGNWIESVYIHEVKQTGYAELVVGLRGHQGKIQIFNNRFEAAAQPISTPHGVRIVGTYDLDGDGVAEIIAGGDDDNVYTYKRDGSLFWSYRTGDRARGLVIRDIDADGHMEIVVGSEDRNVHVLDSEGHLKWRYYTPHRVLSVNTLDFDQEGEIGVFFGTDDGTVLFFTKAGDLLWRYIVGDRVCGVQAADCNQDGKVEIIVGSEDLMLHLLQVLDQQEISDEMEQCWHALCQQEGGSNELVYNLVRSPSSSLRSFAIAKISARPVLQERDTAALQELVSDTSGDVRRAFAQQVARLYQMNPSLSRRFMDILHRDQERDVRLALVDSLPAVAQLDENVGFQYLERFSKNPDVWIRRAVVRKLDQLAASSPQQVFRLLLNLLHDETEWIRQEAARAIAHYFDLHEEELIRKARLLITQDVDLPALRLIAYCAKKDSVRDIFLTTIDLIENLAENNIVEKLENIVKTFESIRSLKHGDQLWQVYDELYCLQRMKTIEEITRYKCRIDQASLIDPGQLKIIGNVLYHLQEVAGIMATYLKRERLGDRLASLLEATSAIEKIYTDLEYQLSDLRGQKSTFPEGPILETLLTTWRKMIVGELGHLRGKADLKPELRTKFVPSEERVGIRLDIRNDGRSPADNVRVHLKESDTFEVIGKSTLSFETIPVSDTIVAEFTISLKGPSQHLTFELTYADAESREKTLVFSDRLETRQIDREFKRIPNPYSIGTPIQTSDMFYGREEDLAMLTEDLTSVSANMVVVLFGQRRSGKSSLLYQLLNTSSLDPHIPIYIDMQHETLDMSTSRFLYHLAGAIHRNLNLKGIEIDPPDVKNFSEDPTYAFDQYLDTLDLAREGRKLIIMLDEFEILEQKVTEKVLAGEFFEYLRSLMQHRKGINFLLSGTHTIEQLTKEYWSVFFNIARHHRLSSLKDEAARQLITDPVKEYLEYDPFAVEKIRQLTANQPYFIQLICRSLIAHANEVRKSYITLIDVNTVQDRVMETGQVHFKWLWGQTSTEERLVLSTIAHEGGDEGRPLSLKDIAEVYHSYGLPFQQEKVLLALENLAEMDVVERGLEGTLFTIPIGLIRRWLREIKPLKRVMLEEDLLR
ncbi:MAG TPA: FG-GAP-like repeat-containing protein [Ktedonobacteraceae bacterium]|nr:FG-GAP-like repeat-containing protein [Ktedonobacteraceae bacterium]